MTRDISEDFMSFIFSPNTTNTCYSRSTISSSTPIRYFLSLVLIFSFFYFSDPENVQRHDFPRDGHGAES